MSEPEFVEEVINELMPPSTPMCEKWARANVEARIVLNFLEWAYEEKRADLVDMDNDIHVDRLTAVYAYFDIDANQLEMERRDLLQWQYELNDLSSKRS